MPKTKKIKIEIEVSEALDPNKLHEVICLFLHEGGPLTDDQFELLGEVSENVIDITFAK